MRCAAYSGRITPAASRRPKACSSNGRAGPPPAESSWGMIRPRALSSLGMSTRTVPPGRLGGWDQGGSRLEARSGGTTLGLSRLGTKDPMAPSSRHLYPEWLRSPNARAGTPAARAARSPGRRDVARLAMAARRGPPLRHPASTSPWRRRSSSCARAGWSSARDRPEPLARGGPDLPAGLPAAGAHDRLPLHCRGGVPPVARHRPRPGRCRPSRRALHGGARVRLAPRRWRPRSSSRPES